jgi:hypothetical protein
MGQLFLSCGWHGKVGRCRKVSVTRFALFSPIDTIYGLDQFLRSVVVRFWEFSVPRGTHCTGRM